MSPRWQYPAHMAPVAVPAAAIPEIPATPAVRPRVRQLTAAVVATTVLAFVPVVAAVPPTRGWDPSLPDVVRSDAPRRPVATSGEFLVQVIAAAPPTVEWLPAMADFARVRPRSVDFTVEAPRSMAFQIPLFSPGPDAWWQNVETPPIYRVPRRVLPQSWGVANLEPIVDEGHDYATIAPTLTTPTLASASVTTPTVASVTLTVAGATTWTIDGET